MLNASFAVPFARNSNFGSAVTLPTRVTGDADILRILLVCFAVPLIGTDLMDILATEEYDYKHD